MKSVAIITMHFPNNYGAVLQVCALSRYLERLGCDVSVINYLPQYLASKDSLTFVGNEKFRKNVLLRIVYLAGKLYPRLKQKLLFARFRKCELKLTRPYHSYDELIANSPNADFYFCGSDQIWNCKNETINDPAYFLQFVKDSLKRYSYAVSGTIPNPIPLEMQKDLLPMINGFHSLAFREEELIRIVQPYVGKLIKHVCDPVFLLSSEEWTMLAQKYASIKLKERYILVYPIGGDSSDVFEGAKKLSEETGLPVYCISWSQRKLPCVARTLTCSPYDFLEVFRKADYVVTNSFHGTAFSILFQKTFWVYETYIANHRLKSIVRKLGLDSRLLVAGQEFELVDIDYSLVGNRMNHFIQESTDYLKDIVKSHVL